MSGRIKKHKSMAMMQRETRRLGRSSRLSMMKSFFIYIALTILSPYVIEEAH
jgi:hypothetical protein